MKVLAIWKVPAQSTGTFKQEMRRKVKRQDSPATLLNTLAGFNYFYETEEGFGDITEETALRIAKNNQLNISNFMEGKIWQQKEIEKSIRNTSSEVLKHFRDINHLLAVWQELEGEIKNTQYPSCAPDWFYPYINSLS